MKRVSYKVGDTVALIDGVHYRYLGFNRKIGWYLYEPIEPQAVSVFDTLTDEELKKTNLNKGTVPFGGKVDVNITVITRI